MLLLVPTQAVESEKKVEDPAILELLAQSIKKPKKKVGGLGVCVGEGKMHHVSI
jgi:hypothetical protein